MEITKISSKGQVVIPLKIRNELGIKQGSVMAIDTANKMVILKKIDLDIEKQIREGLEDLKKGKIVRLA